MIEAQQILAEVKKLSKDTAISAKDFPSRVWGDMPAKLREVFLWAAFFIALYYFSAIIIEEWFSLLAIANEAVCLYEQYLALHHSILSLSFC